MTFDIRLRIELFEDVLEYAEYCLVKEETLLIPKFPKAVTGFDYRHWWRYRNGAWEYAIWEVKSVTL